MVHIRAFHSNAERLLVDVWVVVVVQKTAPFFRVVPFHIWLFRFIVCFVYYGPSIVVVRRRLCLALGIHFIYR